MTHSTTHRPVCMRKYLGVCGSGIRAGRCRPGNGSAARQRGLTLVEFMIGLMIGLLVILAAVASLTMTRDSARTMNDSISLDQQASLVMMQIGQQIQQTGQINGYMGGMNPDTNTYAGAPVGGTSTGLLNFDNRVAGVSVTVQGDTVVTSIAGTSSNNGLSDTLTISYAIPNDRSPANNCIGTSNFNSPVLSPPPNGGVAQIVNVFAVDSNNNFTCSATGGATAQPIATNVNLMRIRYLVDDGSGIMYQTANQVALTDWPNVKGVEVCLDMQSSVTNVPQQPAYRGDGDCNGNLTTPPNDGRIHRIVRQTFYLHNSQ